MSEQRFYGIDIGGTTVKIGEFSAAGLVRKWEIPTDVSDGGRNIIRSIAAALPGGAAGAGMGVPGVVLADDTVNRCVNLGWGVCRPGDEFQALTGISCHLCNDANAAALGEQWRGSGMGFENVLLITLGTGVGAGVVMNGQLMYGSHGAAGELGHVCVEPTETEPCGCGRYGCLEQYCSATGVVRLARQNGLSCENAKEVFALAAQGNEAALRAVDRACDVLGRTIATVCCAADPQAVLLGGGVSRAGEFLRSRVEAAFHKYAFHACLDTQIRLASLGNDAGIYGAARLAMTE